MTESTTIQTILNKLNKVEDFNPTDLLKEYQNSDGSSFLYLEVASRIIWFRLKYPQGKIPTEFVSFENGMCTMKAYVYSSQDEDSLLATAYGTAWLSQDDFGMKVVECAETTAIGRALANAGFGTQFCGKDLYTPQPVDGATVFNNDGPNNIGPKTESESEVKSKTKKTVKKKAEKNIQSSSESKVNTETETQPKINVQYYIKNIATRAQNITKTAASLKKIEFGPLKGIMVKAAFDKELADPCSKIREYATPTKEFFEANSDYLETFAACYQFCKLYDEKEKNS